MRVERVTDENDSSLRRWGWSNFATPTREYMDVRGAFYDSLNGGMPTLSRISRRRHARRVESDITQRQAHLEIVAEVLYFPNIVPLLAGPRRGRWILIPATDNGE